MNRTKTFLINAFWKLLEEKPYNKITVKDIVDACQVNRNTFYYHFQDIPSLLETAITSWADSILEKHHQYGSPLDCLPPLIQSCMDNKVAILHIYRSIHQDEFLRHLDQICTHILTEYIEMSVKKTGLRSTDQDLLVWFGKCVLVGALLDWLNAGMNYDFMEKAMTVGEMILPASQAAFARHLIPVEPVD